MKKLLVFMCLFISSLSRTGASAEILTVPATNITGVWSSTLLGGQMYEVTASGIYDFSYGHWVVDAEWTWLYGTISEYWRYVDGGGPGSEANDIMDLVIDDQPITWLGTVDGVNWQPHTYSAVSHTYKCFLTGVGTPVNFHVADVWPFGNGGNATGDNAGYLTVTITPVPEPSSLLTLLCGLSGIAGMLRRRNG